MKRTTKKRKRKANSSERDFQPGFLFNAKIKKGN